MADSSRVTEGVSDDGLIRVLLVLITEKAMELKQERNAVEIDNE